MLLEDKNALQNATPILLTHSADYAARWCREHLIEQPQDDTSLTWLCGLGFLYSEYTTSGYRQTCGVMKYDDWLKVLSFCFPEAKYGKVGKKLVVTGVRYQKELGLVRFGI